MNYKKAFLNEIMKTESKSGQSKRWTWYKQEALWASKVWMGFLPQSDLALDVIWYGCVTFEKGIPGAWEESLASSHAFFQLCWRLDHDLGMCMCACQPGFPTWKSPGCTLSTYFLEDF